MKKIVSLMLVCAMLASAALMSACSSKETNDTPDTNASVSNTEEPADAEETEATEETEAPADAEEPAPEEPAVEEEPAAEEPAEPEEDNSGILIDQMETYHYTTFFCPYTDGSGQVGGSASGGFFAEEDDEMAAFIAENPEWYKDTALMSSWDEVEAPFGDCIDSFIAADTDFRNDPNTNGLMVYKTFNVENLSDANLYELYCFYDNTVYIYVNGNLFYYSDAHCGSGDWNGGYDLIKCNTEEGKDLGDFLVEGENYIAISIKNCWGGRELDLYMTYELNSTKKTLEFFPRGSEWHYSVYNCPYTDGEGNIDGSAAGGFFDEATDDMAKFIAENPNFMTDTALLSTWDTASGPFGNIMEDIGWTGSVHGLILYKTFTVENLEDVLACDQFVWDCAYDNAIHTYLNGTEVYVDDGACVTQDWNEGEWILDSAQLAELLVEGENYFVVTIKDAWGGRNFDAGFSAKWN
ncbi:MAG: hypothetical protein ACI4V1_07575 [Eubacteriales bacterium]